MSYAAAPGLGATVSPSQAGQPASTLDTFTAGEAFWVATTGVVMLIGGLWFRRATPEPLLRMWGTGIAVGGALTTVGGVAGLALVQTRPQRAAAAAEQAAMQERARQVFATARMAA